MKLQKRSNLLKPLKLYEILQSVRMSSLTTNYTGPNSVFRYTWESGVTWLKLTENNVWLLVDIWSTQLPDHMGKHLAILFCPWSSEDLLNGFPTASNNILSIKYLVPVIIEKSVSWLFKLLEKHMSWSQGWISKVAIGFRNCFAGEKGGINGLLLLN